MIIKRLAEGIKNQDWFVVMVEVMIVVVGIFIGLQVTEWNDEQNNMREEQKILQNLSVEVDDIVFQKLTKSTEAKEELSELEDIINILFGDDLEKNLNVVLCRRAAVSYGNNWNYIPINTADEIISSGKLSLIQNDELRILIMQYRSQNERHSFRMGSMNQRAILLLGKYPKLIFMSSLMGETAYECDEEKIRQSPAFRSDLLTNIVRRFIVSSMMEAEIALLRKLKTTVDGELGITHEKATQ